MKRVSSSLLVAIAFSVSAASPPSILAQQPAAQPAEAPTPERLDLARRFVALAASPDQFMEALHSEIAASMDCGCGDETPAAAAHKAQSDKEVARFFALAEPKIRARMMSLMEVYSRVYAGEFSTGELQQMVSFASSPAGRHYLSARMKIETDGGVQAQKEGFRMDLEPVMIEFQKQLCQEHTAQRIAAGDKNAKCPLAGIDETAAG